MRKRLTAYEDVPKRMLKYLEDSEDLKVGLGEEQLESLEEADCAKQARNERGQKLFQIFWKEEKEENIASWARWDAQKKK